MNRRSQLVTFHLSCAQRRAWLVLSNDHQTTRVLEMHEKDAGNWTISTELIAGEYRCRYYGGDDQSVVYCGAANVDGSVDCGLDGLLSVKIPEEATGIEFVL